MIRIGQAVFFVGLTSLFGLMVIAAISEHRAHTVTEQEPEKWTRITVGKSPVLISSTNNLTRVIVLVNESQTLVAIGGSRVSIFDGIGLLGASPNRGDGGVLTAETANDIYAVSWEEGSVIAFREKLL